MAIVRVRVRVRARVRVRGWHLVERGGKRCARRGARQRTLSGVLSSGHLVERGRALREELE